MFKSRSLVSKASVGRGPVCRSPIFEGPVFKGPVSKGPVGKLLKLKTWTSKLKLTETAVNLSPGIIAILYTCTISGCRCADLLHSLLQVSSTIVWNLGSALVKH